VLGSHIKRPISDCLDSIFALGGDKKGSVEAFGRLHLPDSFSSVSV
jgi:hypothetical protein